MPILALYCGSCHGLPSQNPAANLSLRSYSGVMEGGNLGPVVKPGDPAGSPLIAFIDGRRGEAQRMPMNAPPLRRDRIELIRRWIAEGAKADADTAPKVTLRREADVIPGRTLRIEAHAAEGCFVTIEAFGKLAEPLWVAESATAPFVWTITAEREWPPRIAVSLTVWYCQADPKKITLSVK